MSADTAKKTFVIKGIGASPGIVKGKAQLFDRMDTHASFYKLTDPSQVTREVKRLRKALRDSEKQLVEVKTKLSDVVGPEPLYIIDVHLMILTDKKFVTHSVQHIRSKMVNAEWAVRMTVDKYREIFDRVDDDYLRGRFSDIQYVGQRVLTNLAGKNVGEVAPLEEGVIIIAQDLSPADTAQMVIDRVGGFATDIGGRTSHTAIVARSMEIPAVVGLESGTRLIRNDDEVIIDGSSGLVIVNPDPEMLVRYEEKRKHYLKTKADSLKQANLPAVTQDRYRVEIGGNIEFIEEIPSVVTHGADGIGLYRTEFIYINKENPPTEEEHFSHYRRVVGVKGLTWSTIRTFDLGGDKFFSGSKVAKEMNPQMGLRAIRFCLREEKLFKIQLKAILRASALGKTRILFPMISGVEEIRQAKRVLEEVKAELTAEEVVYGDDVEIGGMIEVPSAVIIARELAREVDFFSIGTNDLIQYVLAIDRINDRVTYLYEPLHPAVLRLIKQVVDIGHEEGIRVAMCGEMAGDPSYTMILLGMELDELSMNPLAIPKVKRIVRNSTLKECKALLKKVINLSSASEIRSFVEKSMRKRFPEEFPLNSDNN
ncbi:MAG: phosphoenolpyruvate--protein phosphotransferase [Smithellaceae bacterium]|nr:phosphoenolpyruvate--protein phosphotransferase [Smithellaceae bacterium]